MFYLILLVCKKFLFYFLSSNHNLLCFFPVTHSLKYCHTALSQAPNLPEYVAVSLVDDVQISYYDSNIQRLEPKEDWMNDLVDPQYWEIKNTHQQEIKTDGETGLGIDKIFTIPILIESVKRFDSLSILLSITIWGIFLTS
uniref:MHC class I-like antigen recognition-like domain-containing protein n=1 Tax=Fundulus heteroclitus TaxID=8078 RepID=A0A3Q2PMT4_FUNHE